MADGLRLRAEIRGAREIARALQGLPRDAQREVKDGSQRLARGLAAKIRAAGRAEGRQTARAARTVRAARGLNPTVVAGPHPLLFATEFGATRRFGWYRKGRYHDSVGRQFKPHLGRGSYWFFRTLDREQPQVTAEFRAMARRIIDDWAAR